MQPTNDNNAFVRFNQAEIAQQQRLEFYINLLWLLLLIGILAIADYGTFYYIGYYTTH